MARTSEGMRIADIPPTTLRFPPELRERLMREATINGRSLSQEVIVRIRSSFDGGAVATATSAVVAREPQAAPVTRSGLSEAHRQLLSQFDSLAPEKQLALLTLLRR